MRVFSHKKHLVNTKPILTFFLLKQNMSAKLRTLAINNNYSDNQAKLVDTTRRQLNLVFVGQSLYEFLQGGQFPFVHQTKLLNKKHEMLE